MADGDAPCRYAQRLRGLDNSTIYGCNSQMATNHYCIFIGIFFGVVNMTLADIKSFSLSTTSLTKSRTEVTIKCSVTTAVDVRATVWHDGKLLRTLYHRVPEKNAFQAEWDGCDALGNRYPAGQYVIQVETNETLSLDTDFGTHGANTQIVAPSRLLRGPTGDIWVTSQSKPPSVHRLNLRGTVVETHNVDAIAVNRDGTFLSQTPRPYVTVDTDGGLLDYVGGVEQKDGEYVKRSLFLPTFIGLGPNRSLYVQSRTWLSAYSREHRGLRGYRASTEPNRDGELQPKAGLPCATSNQKTGEIYWINYGETLVKLLDNGDTIAKQYDYNPRDYGDYSRWNEINGPALDDSGGIYILSWEDGFVDKVVDSGSWLWWVKRFPLRLPGASLANLRHALFDGSYLYLLEGGRDGETTTLPNRLTRWRRTFSSSRQKRMTLNWDAQPDARDFSTAIERERQAEEREAKSPPPITGATAEHYWQSIYVDRHAPTSITDSAAELAKYLEQLVRKPFIIHSDVTRPGIRLLVATSKHAPEDASTRLDAHSSLESFLLRGDENGLVIVGKTELGIPHGVYTYLHELGCRWFFPGDHWEIIPRRRSIRKTIDRVEAPAFLSRRFFGTGGFGGHGEKAKEMEDRWATYQRRNRLGGEFRVDGHVGHDFNSAFSKTLNERPELLALVDGQRQSLAPHVKHCTSNPDFQTMWTQWRLNSYFFDYIDAPEKAGKVAISVEPCDGGGYCQCESCHQLGSVSDRIFQLANHTARAFQRYYPKKYVSLYAYASHAAVPDIQLEPNIFVALIPYGFQYTGLTPEEFIESWRAKHNALGLYDYWCLPTWSHNLPELKLRDDVVDRIRYWHKNQLTSFTGESSYAAGGIGLAWYLAARLLWNPDEDAEQILDDFFKRAFRRSTPPMRRMLERWGQGFRLSEHELALSYRDLHAANKLCRSRKVKNRINDFALYVEYIRRYYEYKKAVREKRDADTRRETIQRYYQHMWSMYSSAMIDAYRMTLQLHHDWEQSNELVRSVIDWEKADFWTLPESHDDASIGELIKRGIADFKPVKLETQRYSSKLVPLTQTRKNTSEKLVGVNSVQGHFELLVCIRTSAELNPVFETLGASHVVIRDRRGTTLATHPLSAAEEWTPVTLHFPKPGFYRCQFVTKNWNGIKWPKELAVVSTDGLRSAGQVKAYFYVPRGQTRFAIYAPDLNAPPPTIAAPNGRKITPKSADGLLFAIDIPAGTSGKVWSIEATNHYRPITLLNIPNYFAYSADGLLVPSNVRP